MKHEINIKDATVKVGGHDYSVLSGKQTSRQLLSGGYRGTHSPLLREIEISEDFSPQDTSCTFIHEICHAVNTIYMNGKLGEEDIEVLANGLHQIAEELEIRFVL